MFFKGSRSSRPHCEPETAFLRVSAEEKHKFVEASRGVTGKWGDEEAPPGTGPTQARPRSTNCGREAG